MFHFLLYFNISEYIIAIFINDVRREIYIEVGLGARAAIGIIRLEAWAMSSLPTMTNAAEASPSGTADCLVRKSWSSRTSRQMMRGLLRHRFDQAAHRWWRRVSLGLFQIFIFCWTSFMKIAIREYEYRILKLKFIKNMISILYLELFRYF